MYFSTFTLSIMDWLFWKYYQRARENKGTMSKRRSLKAIIDDATFFAAIFCSHLKLHALNAWAPSRLFWFPWGILSNTSEQLASSFNWSEIFFWPNLKEAVILIRAIRERILNLLNTMFNCRNMPYPQLIGCRKRLLQNLA